MYPSLSAAILPIIIHTQSWLYPLSVCILTAIIASGKKIIDNYHNKKSNGISFVENTKDSGKVVFTKEEGIHWVKLLISILLVSAVALYLNWDYIITPPLIVAFVGLSKPGREVRTKGVLVLIILVSAAFLGVSWIYFIYYYLYWPIWVSSGLSMVCVLLMFHLFQFTLPPAAAIALLPTIIPVEGLWMYPVQILIGSTIFLLINVSWFKIPKGYMGYQKEEI
ncbi:HPP family protein [Clostridium sp.]|uniref:HPP family protein n=1 Tax=Clostridium sp. TaxID=1506 RepID=UPI0026299B14|nr:HPP family protein [uncultured Clostridium sp.]